jgi:esterase/lipase
MSSKKFFTGKITIDTIPALVCHKKEIKNSPLIIFSHGFTGTKEDFLEEMKLYAEHNFFTVSIDNKGHGERNDMRFFEYAMEKEIHQVIDFFENNDRIDIGHTVMIGVSMGGFITFRALTLEKRISAAALFISSPVWDELPKNVPLIDNPESRAQLKRYSKENSPLNFMEKFYNRNMLIQIGKADNHFDTEKVRLFVDKVNQHSVDKIQLIEYEKVAHEVTPDMKRKALDWIIKMTT